MKINSTSQSLSLVLRTLDGVIKPELQTSHTQDALDHIRITLIDLLKRLGPTKKALHDCVRHGEELHNEILNLLDEKTSTEASPITTESFDSLVIHHEELTSRLTDLCRKLVLGQKGNKDASFILEKAAYWELSYYKSLRDCMTDNIETNQDKLEGEQLSRDAFENFLISQRGPIKLEQFEGLPGGFGKQTYMCTLIESNGSNQNLVIRKESVHPIQQHSSFRLEQEFSLVSALHKTGFVCPEPLELCLEFPGVAQPFYTMPRIDGVMPGRWLDGHQEQLTEEIFLHASELLAQLHSLPLEAFTDHLNKYDSPNALEENIEERYRRNLQGWKEYAQKVEHPPSPLLIWMLDWLDRNIPKDKRRPVLTHGDYNIHNMLAQGSKIVAVLDWECADFGAPEQDMAYIKPHVEAHMDWDRFVAHYRLHGGKELNDDTMAFYGVWSIMRAFLGGLKGAMNLQEGLTHDLRYIQIEQGFHNGLMSLALAHASNL